MLVILTEQIATQTIVVTFKENNFLGCQTHWNVSNQTSGDICISNQKLHSYLTPMYMQLQVA